MSESESVRQAALHEIDPLYICMILSMYTIDQKDEIDDCCSVHVVHV